MLGNALPALLALVSLCLPGAVDAAAERTRLRSLALGFAVPLVSRLEVLPIVTLIALGSGVAAIWWRPAVSPVYRPRAPLGIF